MEVEVSEIDELLVELIERVTGELGVVIYSMGIEGEFTDEQLAEELGVEINDVRRVLFALYEIGLASYRRKKDEDTGWMEYYWRINYEKEREVLRKELEKTRDKLSAKLQMEDETVYYICMNGCVKVKYEEAMEYGFACPKCGGMLEYLDSREAVARIREELEKIEDMLRMIS
ncbi:Transcription factor E {TFE} [Geoglobus ahangari]|uniref:Transcription factor E n=1 Tax=Geoglobus ahangari TaxID=113653 RepID=A0A0F7IGW4_9EURY|nr:transcription factor E [Geoglobus ahangari]AKG92110.1 Transcription factor E {TFE} [Geoglobus ahangari]NOY11718.1 transcription factor E [Archaeoglobi archaeon]